MEDNKVKGKINDLTYEVEKKLDQKEKNRSIKALIGVLVTIICTIGLVLVTAAQFPIGFGLSLGLIGSLSAIKSKIEHDIAKLEIDRYNQEIEHLDKVEENGLKEVKKLKTARENKLEELVEKQPELDIETKKAEDLSTYASIVAVAGAALAACVTPWIALPAAVAELMSISFGMEALDKNAELQNINNRIDNLQNDLEVTDAIEESEKTLEDKVKEIAARRKETLAKIKENSKKSTIVDEYVESLANQNDNDKPKELRK